MSVQITFAVYLSFCGLILISQGQLSHGGTSTRSSGSGRDERFLSIFKIVRIPHTICSPGSEFQVGQQTGSCYTSQGCQDAKGVSYGSCAQGYGVCCVVKETCAPGDPATVSVNGTQLLSPTNLGNSTICQYRFPRPKNVCQVRLDFNKFVNNQNGPFNNAPDGNCNSDTLTFTGASNTRNLGPLCGNLTGQHIYLDYGSSSEIDAFMYTGTAMSMSSGLGWNIQVTYIKCDSTEKAPPGCLQYFTDQAGTVQSFNYNGMQQLNNEDYSVCVKSIPGMNQISWNTCGGFEDFFITKLAPIEPPPGFDVPPITDPLTGDDCMQDWVMIFGVNKFCGNALEGPVISTTQPFLMQVHFDDNELEDGDDRNVGFCMKYQQSP